MKDLTPFVQVGSNLSYILTLIYAYAIMYIEGGEYKWKELQL